MSALGSYPALDAAAELQQLLRVEFQKFTAQIPKPLWQNIDFDATMFSTANAMTWTVLARNIDRLAILQVGPTAWIFDFGIAASSIGGTLSNSVRIRLPLGLMAAKTSVCVGWGRDNVTPTTFLCFVSPNSAFMTITRTDVANFAATTGGNIIRGQIAFESIAKPK